MLLQNYLKLGVIKGSNALFNICPFNSSEIKEAWFSYLYENLERGTNSPLHSVNSYFYYKCIFVHIPKTGGLSTNISLFNSYGGSHLTIKDYEKIFGEKLFESYFKFSFVRNPWDRLLSAYLYLKNGGINKEDFFFYEKQLKQYEDFSSFVENWVNTTNIENQVHFKKQTDFLTNKNNCINIDFIGRYENINSDFLKIKERLGITANNIALKHLNSSPNKSKDYKAYYNNNTKKIVAKVYEQDIDYLKYTF